MRSSSRTSQPNRQSRCQWLLLVKDGPALDASLSPLLCRVSRGIGRYNGTHTAACSPRSFRPWLFSRLLLALPFGSDQSTGGTESLCTASRRIGVECERHPGGLSLGYSSKVTDQFGRDEQAKANSPVSSGFHSDAIGRRRRIIPEKAVVDGRDGEARVHRIFYTPKHCGAKRGLAINNNLLLLLLLLLGT